MIQQYLSVHTLTSESLLGPASNESPSSRSVPMSSGSVKNTCKCPLTLYHTVPARACWNPVAVWVILRHVELLTTPVIHNQSKLVSDLCRRTSSTFTLKLALVLSLWISALPLWSARQRSSSPIDFANSDLPCFRRSLNRANRQNFSRHDTWRLNFWRLVLPWILIIVCRNIATWTVEIDERVLDCRRWSGARKRWGALARFRHSIQPMRRPLVHTAVRKRKNRVMTKGRWDHCYME